MIKTVFRSTLFATVSLMPMLFLVSCGDSGSIGKSSMRLPELKLSMDVPEGWKVDRNPEMCSKEDYIGLLLSEPLEGKTFSKTVDSMSTEFGAKILSRNEMKAAGYPAVKVLMDDPGGMKVLRLYLDCGSSIAYVSYAVPKDEFQIYEAAFEKSIASLRKE